MQGGAPDGDGSLFRLARPEAATKYLRLVRGRALSAFSCQLLHKHRQHAFDFGDPGIELFIVIEPDQLQISTQEEMIFELAGRAPGDTAEAGQLGISAGRRKLDNWPRATELPRAWCASSPSLKPVALSPSALPPDVPAFSLPAASACIFTTTSWIATSA